MSSPPHSQEDAFGTPPDVRKSRFFFDVREGSRFISDDEGLELDRVDEAEGEAAKAAAEIGRDRLLNGDACDITIEVRNEQGHRVLTVTVSMQVDRVHPPPLAPTSQVG